MSLLITPQVTSVAKAGSTALNGAVTLTGGTNVTLTQSGQDISIAAAGASISIGATVTSGTAGSVLWVDTGPVLAQANSGLFYDKTNVRLGVGTASPASTIEAMCGASTEIGLIVQGAASQSANLTDWQDSSANNLSIVKANGDFQYLQSARTVSGNTAFFDSSTAIITVSAAANLFMFRARNTFNLTAAHTIFNFNNFFLHNNTYKNDPSLTGNIASQFNCFVNQGIFQGDTNATTACNSASCFLDIQTFNRINSGTLAITEWNSFTSAPVVGAGVTVTNRRGAWIKDVTNTGTVTTNTAVKIDAQTSGGTNYTVDVASKMQLDGNGLVIKYNNISTVSGGVPSELATADPTGQTAAIAATTLYTPTATGLFRISIYLQVTQAATTSSILGGATGVVITYNDGDGNVAQSNTAALATTAGAIAVTAAGNTTATNLEGTLVIYARTGVAIQYAIGYTSVGITVMKYAAHLKVEAF